ncbi:MAG TPA: hypothetical protein VEH01_04125 [Nitrososphaerales archaeon]|nr:hypothetical protein [Nitrososphaerales archaeon]
MSASIEATVKALVEFESELDKAKAGATGAKKRVSKDALDWAEGARAAAVSRAQQIANQRIAEAKEEAEAEAKTIREKGEAALKAFESSISKHRAEAAELAASRLLGGSD